MAPARLLAALAAAALALDGCGRTVGPDDGGGPPPPPAPRLDCDRVELAFGGVPVGRSRALEVTCTNPGSAAVVLGPAVLEGDAAFEAEATAQAIEAGASATFTLTFEPHAPELFRGALVLATAEEPVARVLLEGQGLVRAISRTPAATCGPGLDLGSVAAGALAVETITVANASAVPVMLREVSLLPGTDPRFSLGGARAGVLVPPGGDATVEVRFRGDGGGPGSGILRVDTDDPGTGTFDVCLEAFGGVPVLACAPDPADLGEVVVGFEAQATITCAVEGPIDPSGRRRDQLVVERVRVEGDPAFSLPAFVPAATLRSGDGFDFPVALRPAGGGDVRAAVVLEGRDGPLARVSLRGRGRDLGTCTLAVEPERLLFEGVAPGRTASLPVTLRNDGPGICEVSSVTMMPGGDVSFTLAEVVGPITLHPFTSAAPLVTFAPEHGGAQSARIAVASTDAASPYREVVVDGRPSTGCLVADPPSLRLGPVSTGCAERDREVVVENVCGRPVTIDAFDPVGETTATVEERPSLPIVLLPGMRTSFSVGWRSVEDGAERGGILVRAEGDDDLLVPIHASTSSGAVRTDTFTAHADALDLLFVLHGFQLADDLEVLAAEASRLLDPASARGLDLRLGAIGAGFDPTGSCGGDRLLPADGISPQIVDASSPSATAELGAILTGRSCSGGGQALDVAARALAGSLADDLGAAFVRRDARLAIVFVSDLSDFSPMAPSAYATTFQQAKRHAGDVTVHALAGDDGAACQDAQDGRRFIQVADATGGSWRSLCEGDAAELLDVLADGPLVPRTFYELDGLPTDGNGDGMISDTAGELEVHVDGTVLPSVLANGDRQWRFDHDRNAVEFLWPTVPEVGARIEVVYPMHCL